MGRRRMARWRCHRPRRWLGLGRSWLGLAPTWLGMARAWLGMGRRRLCWRPDLRLRRQLLALGSHSVGTGQGLGLLNGPSVRRRRKQDPYACARLARGAASAGTSASACTCTKVHLISGQRRVESFHIPILTTRFVIVTWRFSLSRWCLGGGIHPSRMRGALSM